MITERWKIGTRILCGGDPVADCLARTDDSGGEAATPARTAAGDPRVLGLPRPKPGQPRVTRCGRTSPLRGSQP